MTDFLSQLVRRRDAESSNPGIIYNENLASSEVSRSIDLIQRATRYIIESGLFDAEFYLTNYPDIAAAGVDPFEHFFDYGYREGRCPNPYFDPLWYLEANADVRESKTQPLLHYAFIGDKEGRRPSPRFDPDWYRKQYNLA